MAPIMGGRIAAAVLHANGDRILSTCEDKMDIKLFATVFVTIFLAELGDKTQLATFLFASKTPSSLITVFFGASLALVTTTLLGVAAGGLISQHVDQKYLSFAAGVGFVLVGIWTIWRA